MTWIQAPHHHFPAMSPWVSHFISLNFSFPHLWNRGNNHNTYFMGVYKDRMRQHEYVCLVHSRCSRKCEILTLVSVVPIQSFRATLFKWFILYSAESRGVSAPGCCTEGLDKVFQASSNPMSPWLAMRPQPKHHPSLGWFLYLWSKGVGLDSIYISANPKF